MNDFPVGVGNVTNDLVAVRRPVRGFGKCQLAVDATRVIDDDQFSILVHPALAPEQIMDARRHFIPRVVFLVAGQTYVHRPCFNSNHSREQFNQNH